MNGDHGHRQSIIPSGERKLVVALTIVLAIMFAEIIGGMLSGSLALVSDAGHMFVDALALGLSLFALTLAKRPPTPTRTYGYHRVEIVAAMFNGATLVLVSLYIFYEAYRRFLVPSAVHIPLMISVATVGLLANLMVMLLLRGISRENLNVRAAFWHVLGDAASSIGVIAAGVAMWFTGWYIADPILAATIGCVILWGAARLVIESVDILMETVPKHIVVDNLVTAIKKIPGVDDVHDVHVWTVTSGLHALSAHVVIEDQTVSQSGEIVKKITDDLARKFAIRHSTIQLECMSCPTDLVCGINRNGKNGVK